MQPGPQPREAVESRSRQQMLRRRNWRARANVVRVIASLLRLGVLPLSTVSQATDVARLTLLAGALRREKLPEEVVLGILMLDWAARAPDLTANFMETVRRRGARLKKLRPEKILSMYTKSATQTDWKTFWHGPTRIHTERFLSSVSPASLLAVGARLAVPRIRGSAVLAYVQALPHMGPYTALSLLRAVAAGAGKKLRDCRRAAVAMSFNTSLLAGTLPFADAARELRRITGEQYEENLLAFFYCEVIKILSTRVFWSRCTTTMKNAVGLSSTWHHHGASGWPTQWTACRTSTWVATPRRSWSIACVRVLNASDTRALMWCGGGGRSRRPPCERRPQQFGQ